MERTLHAGYPILHRLFAEKPYLLLSWPALAMVAGTLVRAALGDGSQRLAIVPRTRAGLVGLITGPFLHANLGHLVANLPPFLVLGALVLRKGSQSFLETAVVVALGGGLLVWSLARRGAHMGASGVVFGFFGYLLGVAYWGRATGDILVAIVVLLVYGGLLLGLRPARQETSWEGHLAGLVVGLAKVWWLRR